jgi:hypothetical protein
MIVLVLLMGFFLLIHTVDASGFSATTGLLSFVAMVAIVYLSFRLSGMIIARTQAGIRQRLALAFESAESDTADRLVSSGLAGHSPFEPGKAYSKGEARNLARQTEAQRQTRRNELLALARGKKPSSTAKAKGGKGSSGAGKDGGKGSSGGGKNDTGFTRADKALGTGGQTGGAAAPEVMVLAPNMTAAQSAARIAAGPAQSQQLADKTLAAAGAASALSNQYPKAPRGKKLCPNCNRSVPELARTCACGHTFSRLSVVGRAAWKTSAILGGDPRQPLVRKVAKKGLDRTRRAVRNEVGSGVQSLLEISGHEERIRKVGGQLTDAGGRLADFASPVTSAVHDRIGAAAGSLAERYFPQLVLPADLEHSGPEGTMIDRAVADPGERARRGADVVDAVGAATEAHKPRARRRAEYQTEAETLRQDLRTAMESQDAYQQYRHDDAPSAQELAAGAAAAQAQAEFEAAERSAAAAAADLAARQQEISSAAVAGLAGFDPASYTRAAQEAARVAEATRVARAQQAEAAKSAAAALANARASEETARREAAEADWQRTKQKLEQTRAAHDNLYAQDRSYGYRGREKSYLTPAMVSRLRQDPTIAGDQRYAGLLTDLEINDGQERRRREYHRSRANLAADIRKAQQSSLAYRDARPTGTTPGEQALHKSRLDQAAQHDWAQVRQQLDQALAHYKELTPEDRQGYTSRHRPRLSPELARTLALDADIVKDPRYADLLVDLSR